MIKSFHDYPTVETPSAFIFHSSVKGLKDFTLGNTVVHMVVIKKRLRAMRCQAMED